MARLEYSCPPLTIRDRYYPNASEKAKNIENYVAFYKVRSGHVREAPILTLSIAEQGDH